MSLIDRTESLYAGFSRLRQFARHAVGRVTGTVPSTRGNYKFFIDHAESRHLHRVELSAIASLLFKKGVFTNAEWQAQLEEQTAHYEKALAEEWPEVRPAADGRSYVLDTQLFAQRCADEEWPR